MEVFRSTKDIEPGWLRRKKLFGWTNQSLSNAKYDELKFEYINSISEGRWLKYRHFEICANLRKPRR